MRPECVVPEVQCAVKRKEKKAQKEKDKPNSTTNGSPEMIKLEPDVRTNYNIIDDNLTNFYLFIYSYLIPKNYPLLMVLNQYPLNKKNLYSDLFIFKTNTNIHQKKMSNELL